MPLFNNETYVGNAIKGILSQSYSNFSLVIVNDASTDNSLKIAQEFKDLRITILSNDKNMGCYYSRNIGLSFMKTNDYDIFTFHDSDDFSSPNRFDTLIKYFDDPEILAVQGMYQRLGDNIPYWIEPKMHTNSHAFYSKKVFDSIGYFENVRFGGDTEYWNRLMSFCELNNNYKYALSDDVLYFANMTGNNLVQKYGPDERARYRKLSAKKHLVMKYNKNFYVPFIK